jgi:hypothetical protein
MATYDNQMGYRPGTSLSAMFWIALIIVVALVIGSVFWFRQDHSTASRPPSVTTQSSPVTPPAALPPTNPAPAPAQPEAPAPK